MMSKTMATFCASYDQMEDPSKTPGINLYWTHSKRCEALSETRWPDRMQMTPGPTYQNHKHRLQTNFAQPRKPHGKRANPVVPVTPISGVARVFCSMPAKRMPGPYGTHLLRLRPPFSKIYNLMDLVYTSEENASVGTPSKLCGYLAVWAT